MATRSPIVVEQTSHLRTPASQVWMVVSTLEGVNAELLPLVRMRAPRRFRGRTLDSWSPEEVVPCWLLAAGLVPFDRHRLQLEQVDPGTGFVEESTSWLQRRWRHERTVVASDPSGCSVTDRVTVVPRVAFAAPIVDRTVRTIFGHRHRRLRRRFGT